MDVAHWLDTYADARRRNLLEDQARFEIATLMLRHVLWIGLAALFWTTGLDESLAAGLRARFPGGGWAPWAYICQAALAVLSYETLLFPLTYAIECARARFRATLPSADGELTGSAEAETGFGPFLLTYFFSLTVEVALCTAALTAIHVLRRFAGPFWWLFAAATYALVNIDSYSWFRLARDRQPVDDPEALAALRDALARMGGQNFPVAGIELDPGELEVQRPVRIVRKAEGDGLVFVVARECWMALTPSARLALLLREAAFRRQRRFLRAFAFLLVAVAFAVGGGAADAVAARAGWRTLAAPEAVPLLVIVFFSLALVFGCLLKYVARRLNLQADIAAAKAHPGGAAAFAALLQELFPLTDDPPRLPRWCTLFLFEYAPLSRALRVERACAAAADPPPQR